MKFSEFILVVYPENFQMPQQPPAPVPQQAIMGVPNSFEYVMQATKFFPPASSVPLQGEQWAIVGAETQVIL